MKSGCPYARAIKQSLNKRFCVSALHSDLSKLIAEFSHQSFVHSGSYMTWSREESGGVLPHRHHFFIVQEMISPHWCTGFFCPPRIEFGSSVAEVYYHPDIRRRSRIQKKKIFNPFSNALVRVRNRRFRLHNTNSHESMSHFPPILA